MPFCCGSLLHERNMPDKFQVGRPKNETSLISRGKAPSAAWREKRITPISACCRWNGIQDGGLAVSYPTLGSIPIRRFCVRRPVPGRPRATTPAEDRFLALSARRRRTTTVPQLVADHFQASGRRISATTVRNRLHNAGLYARRPVVCVPLNGRQRRNRLREHVSWTQQQWASVLFTTSPDLQWK
ncbi:HTH_Tnp_Tc3_2 domain-containing protein [Trichonephila clavipes]|nr:HTH_Tnp_Tc3_2 domain-containing protein [Trichonephila clavipes]